MTFPWGALVTSSLLFLVVAFSLPNVHAINSSLKHAAHNIIGPNNPISTPKHHRRLFLAGPWKKAQATFYDGGSGTFGMNIC
jgi:hypothetical protein